MIARQAYKHVQSEYPHIFDPLLGNFDSDGKFFNNHIQNTNYVTRYANYPDIKGEFLNPFNDGNGFNYDHFYNSDNGGNYFNMSIPSTVIDSNNVKTRFIQHYNEAVSLWKSGNKVESYKSLGQALHFATDLSTPHHVGDQLPPWVTGPFAAAIAGAFLPPPGNTAYLAAAGVLTTYVADMIIGHALFESTVDDNITDIFNDSDNKNPDGSWIISKDYSNLTLDEIVEDTVALASDQYPFMNMFSNHTNIAYAIVPNAVDVSIGILKKFAEEVQFNTANLSNNEIRIDKVNWTIQGAYTLPSTLKGRTVTQIGDSAFENQIQMSEITLPNALTSIGDFAFSGCTRLSDIVLPIGLESIGINSFSSCTNLTSIILPNTLTSIGAVAFNNCSSLKTIVIPDSVTSIGNIAFANCTNLESITFQKETANIT